MKATKLVTVNVTLSPMPKYVAKYIVLRNCSCREVMATARKNPNVWVFPFVTHTVGECPNYTWLGRMAKRDARYSLVVRPLWIGNLKPVESAIEQIVVRTLGTDCEEVKWPSK